MRRTNGPQRAEAIRNAELVLQMMVEMDKDIFELARQVNPPTNVESQPTITHDAGYTIVQSKHFFSAWPTDNDELAAGHVRQWQQRVGELRDAIDAGGFDLAPCRLCGRTIVCLPDGIALCEQCSRGAAEAAKEEE